jgi:purine-cytosine permease-like protein
LACFVVGAALVTVVGVYGHALIVRVQKWLTGAFALLTVAYAALSVPQLDLARVRALPPGGPEAFLGGVVFAMTVLGLGWVNCGADYSRYLPRDTPARDVVWWTALGGALPPGLLLGLGVLLAGSDPGLADRAAGDPVGALAATLPTWFLVPYVVCATGGFLAGAIMDIYSSSLSLLALGAPLRRHQAALVDGVLMVLGGAYLLFVSPSFLATFQAFLSIIGVVMAAWVAIFLVELGRPPSATVAVRWGSLASLAFGSVLGLGLITSSDPAAALLVGFLLPAEPGMLGASNVGVLAALVAAGLAQAVVARTGPRPGRPAPPPT